MNGARRWLGLLAVTLGIVVSAQVPALAGTYRHTDARHDVEAFPGEHRAPHNREADVTHLRIRHSTRAIRFDLRLRSAAMVGVSFRVVGFSLRTSGHRYSGRYIQNHNGEVQYDLSDDTAGRRISCDESSGRSGHVVWLRLDSSCLRKPRWIRAAVTIGTSTGRRTDSGATDDALSNRWRESVPMPFTPRVHD